jgi:hypothetical protein
MHAAELPQQNRVHIRKWRYCPVTMQTSDNPCSKLIQPEGRHTDMLIRILLFCIRCNNKKRWIQWCTCARINIFYIKDCHETCYERYDQVWQQSFLKHNIYYGYLMWGTCAVIDRQNLQSCIHTNMYVYYLRPLALLCIILMKRKR